MKAILQRIGNAQGVIIPRSILVQVGFGRDLELEVRGETVVLRKPRPKRHPREGWDAASQSIAAAGDDALVWRPLANADDAKLTW
jgi:antitoxin MazE